MQRRSGQRLQHRRLCEQVAGNVKTRVNSGSWKQNGSEDEVFEVSKTLKSNDSVVKSIEYSRAVLPKINKTWLKYIQMILAINALFCANM